MTMQKFIRDNRKEIDAAIKSTLGHVPSTAGCYCPKSGTNHYHDDAPKINDAERRLWVLNDEGLYLLARRSGVRI